MLADCELERELATSPAIEWRLSPWGSIEYRMASRSELRASDATVPDNESWPSDMRLPDIEWCMLPLGRDPLPARPLPPVACDWLGEVPFDLAAASEREALAARDGPRDDPKLDFRCTPLLADEPKLVALLPTPF